jgi:hypothetical protein
LISLAVAAPPDAAVDDSACRSKSLLTLSLSFVWSSYVGHYWMTLRTSSKKSEVVWLVPQIFMVSG